MSHVLPVQGAIYATDNAAYTWSAAVQETVDATLNRTVSSGISGASYYEGTFSNIQRSPSGDYVAVSSRGRCTASISLASFLMSLEGKEMPSAPSVQACTLSQCMSCNAFALPCSLAPACSEASSPRSTEDCSLACRFV